MSGWRLGLRMAWRQARRAKGRSAMVVALIALPVLALTFAAVSYDMLHLRPAERLGRQLGAADAQVDWQSDGPVRQDPLTLTWQPDSDPPPKDAHHTMEDVRRALPAGTRVIPLLRTTLTMHTATGIGDQEAVGVDLRDPMTRGIATVHSGRVPATPTEVALSAQSARRLGVTLGGTVRPVDHDRPYTVVGVVELPDDLREIMVFQPDAEALADQRPLWLVDTPAPITWDQVRGYNKRGLVVRSRMVVLDPPESSAGWRGGGTVSSGTVGLGVLVVGLATLEVVLLAGPALAVGVRRRQRELGLVAANGGTPAHLRRLVLADGVVLGLLAAALGAGLGILGAFAVRPLVEEHLMHARAGGYRVFPLALAGIAALAVFTGLVAALVPAFTVARQPVVATLSGRRPAVRSRKRWLALGLTLAGGAVVVVAVGAQRLSTGLILAGFVVGELGAVLCTPALVGLVAKLGPMLPAAGRIALRDTARNRAAAAPAISAVMAAVAMSVAIGLYTNSSHERFESTYTRVLPDGYAVVYVNPGSNVPLARLDGALRANLPVRDVAELRTPACPPGTSADRYCGLGLRLPEAARCPYRRDRKTSQADKQRAVRDPRCNRSVQSYGLSTEDTIVDDDGTALSISTAATPADLAAATATLHAGGAVVWDDRYLTDGAVTIEINDSTGNGDPAAARTLTVPAYVLRSGVKHTDALAIPESLARRTGLGVRSAGLLAATSRMPTVAEEDAITGSLREIGPDYRVEVERGYVHYRDPMPLVLAAVAAIVALGAAALATGLAAAERRTDLATLAAVGAPPRVRRILSLCQALVIAGLGSLLGGATGWGMAAGVLYALNRVSTQNWPDVAVPYPIGVPWLNLLVAIVVVPVVAMLGAGLLTRSRLPVERRA